MWLRHRNRSRRLVPFLLSLLLFLALIIPALAHSPGSGRIVRVGWYESPFNTTDEQGRRSGYAYEYQQKLAAYTGWTYEYVMGSWPELLQMLQEGRIDLLSDVSYTPERSETILYSTKPMGEEEYYLFAAPDNREITPEDYSTMDGKRVGANKGSLQMKLLREWAETNGVNIRIEELTGSEEENCALLTRGKLDLYVTLDAFGVREHIIPVCQIGESDFYFAVSKSQPELLSELNSAMSRILEENRYYNQQLYSRYLQGSGANSFLTAEEKTWLEGHGPIRVGYQDNYLSFCAKDPKTGELTGALREYLNVASEHMENARLDFETVAFPTSAAALEALKRGEVDCVFPANLTDYDGESDGYFLTSPLMRTDMSAVIRASDRKTFGKNQRVTVAVNAGNPNYELFLEDHFPDWRAIYFQDTRQCLQAVADHKADCLLISNYRFNNIAVVCEQYQLETISTGVEMDYRLAVKRSDTVLYSILTKMIGVVPAATVNSALSYYFTKDAQMSVPDLLRQNLVWVVLVTALVVGLWVYLALRAAGTEKKAKAGQTLIKAAELDPLTGLYQKNFFYVYADRLYREHPNTAMDAIVLNLERFRSVAAVRTMAFGDQVLRALGEELLAFLKEQGGIASRGEADHFALYCPHLDNARGLFNRLQGRLDTLSLDGSIRLRMGVMPWQKDLPPRRQMEHAERACDMGRGKFKEHLVIYDDTVREKEALERRLLHDLQPSLEAGDFEVHYQGVYDIQADPPRLESAEALLRWRHPELGVMGPVRFVRLLERNGKIGVVDGCVWEQAMRHMAAWRRSCGVTVPVSVNLSRMDLYDPTLEQRLDALAEKYDLQPGILRLQVTESACREDRYLAKDVLSRLRRKGFRVELDNFGADGTSLGLVSDLPLDAWKLDRSIVGALAQNEQSRRMAELILTAAKNASVPVIAEGVETEEQLRILKSLGCTLAQGYYFARPMPAVQWEITVLKNAASA